MALDVAKVLGPRNAPDHRHVRSAAAPHQHRQRQHHAHANADLHTGHQHARKSGHPAPSVSRVIAPGLAQGLHIDQGQHRHQNRSRQHRHRQDLKGLRKAQHHPRHQQGRHHAGHGRLGPSRGIDHGARKAPRHAVAPGEAAEHMGHAQAQQLAIRCQSLLALQGIGLRQRNAFHETNQGNEQSRHAQGQPLRAVQRHPLPLRQARLNRAHHGHAQRGRTTGGKHDEGGDQHHRQRGHARHPSTHHRRAEPAPPQARQVHTRPPQHQHSTQAQGGGGHMDVLHLLPHPQKGLSHPSTFNRNAQDARQLADGDQDGHPRHKTTDHGLAQKISQKPQAQHTCHGEHQARQQRQAHGQGHVFRGSRHRQRQQGTGGHQRGDGHRTHRQHLAAAQKSIGQYRPHTGVQAHGGRQPCQHGVGQAVGDDQHRHHRPRHRIASPVAPLIRPPPGRPAQPAHQAFNPGLCRGVIRKRGPCRAIGWSARPSGKTPAPVQVARPTTGQKHALDRR